MTENQTERIMERVAHRVLINSLEKITGDLKRVYSTHSKWAELPPSEQTDENWGKMFEWVKSPDLNHLDELSSEQLDDIEKMLDRKLRTK